jgi:hypothetical protein
VIRAHQVAQTFIPLSTCPALTLVWDLKLFLTLRTVLAVLAVCTVVCTHCRS